MASSSSSSFDSLTDLELRKKLLDFGYDLPVSPQNRDLLLRKLKSATNEGRKEKDIERRRSMAVEQSNTAAENSAARKNMARTRMSLNEQVIAKTSSTTRTSISTTSGSTGRRSLLPSSNSKHLTVYEKNGNDSDEGSDVEEIPQPSTSFIRKPSTPPRYVPNRASEAGPSTSSGTVYSRRPQPEKSKFTIVKPVSHHESNESEREKRFTSYLNLFRDSGSTNLESVSPRKKTTIGYGSYSEDESDDEDEVPQQPSKLSRIKNFVNPIPWLKCKGKSFHVSKSPATKSEELELPPRQPFLRPSSSSDIGFNNGHSGGNRGVLTKTKKYLGDMFEQKSNGNRREAESVPDGSPTISKYILLGVLSFFLVVAVLYINLGKERDGLVGHHSASTAKASAAKKGPVGAIYPICGMEGVSNTACIPKEKVKVCRTLFNQLKAELIELAKWKGCDRIENEVTLDKAKNMLYRLSEFPKNEIDEAFYGTLYLCVENPKWGLQIEDSDGKIIRASSDVNLANLQVATIFAKEITPYFFCRLWSGFYMVISYAVLLVLGIIVFYITVKFGFYLHGRKKRQENEMFEFVDQILDLLYQQYEKSRETGCEAFLAVNHIRDEMVPPKEKQSKTALWNKAVDYISNNESRIREEIQHISGEEFKVWRWLPSASPITAQRKSMTTSNNKSINLNSSPHLPNLNSTNTENKWQGQAFEMSDGSPNSPPITPTTCLKVRHMWDVNSGTPEEILEKVEQAIIEKCSGSDIYHIGIDPTSTDGCVYVKCATKDDARSAYFSVHGWWFEGHLLSVKFLREERYLIRFPKSVGRTTKLVLRK